MDENKPPGGDNGSKNFVFSIPLEARPGVEKLLTKYEKDCPPFSALEESLRQAGYAPLGGREILSGGFAGPLFRIETSHGMVVEKCFIYGEGRAVEETKLGKSIDWVHDEEKALKNLADIAGIPRYITSVDHGLKGSIVEEYIDGYELFSLQDHVKNPELITQVFKQIRETYTEAAKRGYVYNNLIGSSIMIERSTLQPYLTDWYDHCSGDIETNEKLRAAYEKNLRILGEYEQSLKQMIDQRT